METTFITKINEKDVEVRTKKELSIIDIYNIDKLLDEFYGGGLKRQQTEIDIQTYRADLGLIDLEDDKKDDIINLIYKDKNKMKILQALMKLISWKTTFEQIATLSIALIEPPFKIRMLDDTLRNNIWNDYEVATKPFRTQNF